jgi:hypothetical protein
VAFNLCSREPRLEKSTATVVFVSAVVRLFIVERRVSKERVHLRSQNLT